jgi:sigma-B regulation protein RsbU (phosphoserine phosphatase)
MPREQKRILVVDDEALVAEVTTELLRDRYEVIAVHDGASAIATAAADPPDLVLMDVSMPGMDGYETCRRLKANESTREIPVIFLTGKGAGDQVVLGFAAGGVDYVTKPFHSEALEARLATHLALHDARAELARINQALRNELAWAGELQRRLIGIELPESDRISFDVTYEPVPGLHCGGDYYDIFTLSADRYLVLLGDVSGHGVQAALITVMLKSIIYRGYIRGHRGGFDPCDFLRWLNGRLCTELERLPELFVAMLAFLIDLGPMTATFANAGQHPPCLLRGEEIIPVPLRGPSLGFSSDLSWTTEVVAVAPGDRIVAFTDGLVEAGTGLDADAVAQVLRSCATSERFTPAVLTEARRLSSTDSFGDDVTVVSARLG